MRSIDCRKSGFVFVFLPKGAIVVHDDNERRMDPDISQQERHGSSQPPSTHFVHLLQFIPELLCTPEIPTLQTPLCQSMSNSSVDVTYRRHGRPCRSHFFLLRVVWMIDRLQGRRYTCKVVLGNPFHIRRHVVEFSQLRVMPHARKGPTLQGSVLSSGDVEV